MKIYTLFHRDADGQFAGYTSWRWNKMHKPGIEHQLIGVQYEEAFPIDMATIEPDDHIYIVDFSYERDILQALWAIVGEKGKLVVLDHHKTAQSKLEGLPYVTFDLTKSGALLAWEYFYGESSDYAAFQGALPVPWTCKLVNDRDLWKWEFGDRTKAFNAYLEAMNVRDNWDEWHLLTTHSEYLEDAIMTGEGFVKYHEEIVKNHVASKKMWREFPMSWHDRAGNRRTAPVRFYQGKGMLISELGQGHYTDNPDCLSLEWRVLGDKVVFNMRCADEERVFHLGFFAQDLAGKERGGGHGRAAGFSLPVDQGLRLISYIYNETGEHGSGCVTVENMHAAILGE